MSIASELEAMNAPSKVREAGQEITKYAEMGLRPPTELVAYVRGWVSRNQRNDRYGK